MNFPKSKLPSAKRVDSKDINELESFMKEYELHRVHTEFFERWITLVIASLSLITALAWDDTFKYIFSEVFDHLSSFWQRLLYALLITTLAVIISVVLSKIFLKKSGKKHTHN